MGLIREPKNIDFTGKSTPWTEKELRDFRKIMAKLKIKNTAKKSRNSAVKKQKVLA
jgi:hypothetical protein